LRGKKTRAASFTPSQIPEKERKMKEGLKNEVKKGGEEGLDGPASVVARISIIHLTPP